MRAESGGPDIEHWVYLFLGKNWIEQEIVWQEMTDDESGIERVVYDDV